MANTPTTRYAWNKPDIGDAGWGLTWNDNLDQIDADMYDLSTSKMDKTGGSFTARVVFDDTASGVEALGNVSGATTINLANGNYKTLTLTGNATFSFSNVESSKAVGLILKVTNGASYTITWPASVKWPAGTAPTLTATGVDIISLVTFDGGTTWHAARAQQDTR